jgi:hypothetical protein
MDRYFSYFAGFCALTIIGVPNRWVNPTVRKNSSKLFERVTDFNIRWMTIGMKN